MKLLCKLFGHTWEPRYCEDYHIKHFLICKRCDEIDWKRMASTLFGNRIYFNRSDLDESENVFHEKWLDKHMD